MNRSLAGEHGHGRRADRRFLILHKELDADDGEMTRTQKVRRGFIADRYGPLDRCALRRLEARPHRDRGHVRGRPQGQGRRRCRRQDRREVLSDRSRAEAGGGTIGSVCRDVAREDRRSAAGDVRAERRRAAQRSRTSRSPSAACSAISDVSFDDRARAKSRHHRPQRRRQDVDAQRHQRLLPSAGGPHHLQGPECATTCGPTRPRARASRAPSRTWRCSRACRRSTTSWPAAR